MALLTEKISKDVPNPIVSITTGKIYELTNIETEKTVQQMDVERGFTGNGSNSPNKIHGTGIIPRLQKKTNISIATKGINLINAFVGPITRITPANIRKKEHNIEVVIIKDFRPTLSTIKEQIKIPNNLATPTKKVQ